MMARRPPQWPTTSSVAEQEHLRPALYNLLTCAAFTIAIFCLRLRSWHEAELALHTAEQSAARSRAALLHGAQACGKNVTHIAILGERHTGSNLAEQLLQRNLGSSVSVEAGFTQHKHWMQPEPERVEQLCGTLLVLTTRNAYDWARALHWGCYCCEEMAHVDFPTFLAAKYAPRFAKDASGQSCWTDVNIDEGSKPFDHILQMRAAKLRNVMGLADRWRLPLELVHWEDMLNPQAQVAWVSQLAQKYGLPLRPATEWQGQQQQRDSSLRRSLIEQGDHTPNGGDSTGSSTGGRSSVGSSSSGSSVAGGEQAQGGEGQQLQAVTEEARVWVKEKFSTAARVARSVYLNPQLMQQNPTLRKHLQAVNLLLDPELEASLGYQLINA